MFVTTLVGLWRASAAILSAAKAAGLVVELHSCRGAVVCQVDRQVLTGLRRLQLTVDASELGRLGTAKVAGIDGKVIEGILRAAGQSAAF
eukprot:3860921-Alexandrium_andersonii.AAC.1